MNKRITSLFLMCCLILTLIPVKTHAANIVDSGACGDNVTWTLDSDGVLTISGTGDMWDIELDAAPWHDHVPSIKSVIIENGVISIGQNAFFNCTHLLYVSIPSSVSTIGYYAFSGVTNLNEIEVDDDNPYFCSINGVLFNKDKTLLIQYPAGNARTTYSLPAGLLSIGDFAFASCNSLVNVVIPDGVKSIGAFAFSICDSLQSIMIPKSVSSIGDSALAECWSLIDISVDANNQSYCSVDGVLFNRDKTNLIQYPTGRKNNIYEIPNGTEKIINSAFCLCASLAETTIPDSVKTIETFAFDHCSNLSVVHIGKNVGNIGNYAFGGCNKLTDVYYAGTENQWRNINIGVGNNALSSATRHYISNENINPNNPTLPDTNERMITYSNEHGSYSTWFGPNELSIASDAGINNRYLSTLCAILSDAAYGNGSNLESVYSQMFDGCEWEWQSDGYDANSFCSGIALGKMIIGGKENNILVITIRGTENLFNGEGLADIYKGTEDLWGYPTYSGIKSFEETVMARLNRFINEHQNLDISTTPLKVIITGHSLGGATANLLAARFTKFSNSGAWWSGLATKNSIYAYTFGGIDSISVNTERHLYTTSYHTIYDGYENIHNIYNLYDTFGLGGSVPINNIAGKYGHIDSFAQHDYNLLGNIEFVGDHMMFTYLEAISRSYVPESGSTEVTQHVITKRIWVRCPVDIEVYESGNLVGRIIDNQIDERVTTISMTVVDDEKAIILPADGQYTIKMTATDAGYMTYSEEDLSDTAINVRSFENVKLTEGKTMISEVGQTTQLEDVSLYVVDEEGTPILEVHEDGTETVFQPTVPPFTDVFRDTYYADAVAWAVEKGITTGTSATTFSPDQGCTRGQVVTFLWRAAGSPDVAISNAFSDVPSDQYYAKAVAWAVANNITLGVGNGKFAPNDVCTRGQIVTFLWRYENSPEVIGDSFSDVPASAYYSIPVSWAVANGITNGIGNNRFAPEDVCTRAQIVTFLYRDLKLS